ncbi:MAG: ACT domain-containing protein [Opitutales bacterium]|nr:ACT domain-containing protein [Opitutales bacterium]
MKVLIPTKLNKVAANLLAGQGLPVVQDAETDLETLVAANPDTVIMIVRSEKITSAIIDALPSLKLIVRAGAGYDNIDCQYARKKGIDVMNTPGANANGVAEEVVAMILACYRHIVPADTTTRAGLWEKKKYMGREITKKTIGIVGLGNIGRLLAKRLQGFEPVLIGYDHFLAKQRAINIGVTPVELDTLFERSDIISLHVPGGPATQKMVSFDLLRKMKDGAMLINCSRYGVVDEEALAQVVAEGKKIIYATDVHPKDAAGEKPSSAVADLVLPHLGANTEEANRNAAKRAAEQVIAYFERGDTSCVVNAQGPVGLDPLQLQLAKMLATLGRLVGGNGAIRRVDCTLGGSLRQFRKWFTPRILEGVLPEAEKNLNWAAAEDSLREHGVIYRAKEPLVGNVEEDSIVVEVVSERDGSTLTSTVRGIVAENAPIVSTINGFKGLYFDLTGNLLFVRYTDRPGVLAHVTKVLADAEINIENISAPIDHSISETLAVIKTNKPVSGAEVSAVMTLVKAIDAFAVTF